MSTTPRTDAAALSEWLRSNCHHNCLPADEHKCCSCEAADTLDRLTREREAQAAELARHYKNWCAETERANTAEAERDALKAALAEVAAHDGGRWDWSSGVAERKPEPQELAEAALKGTR